MRKILPIFLSISVCANIYLAYQVINWQKAWLGQILTTSNVEKIFRKSGADTSFNSIKKIAEKEFSNSFKIIQVTDSDKEYFSPDPQAILIDDTKLFFKDSKYVGSKANLPKLNFWWFTNEF